MSEFSNCKTKKDMKKFIGKYFFMSIDGGFIGKIIDVYDINEGYENAGQRLVFGYKLILDMGYHDSGHNKYFTPQSAFSHQSKIITEEEVVAYAI